MPKSDININQALSSSFRLEAERQGNNLKMYISGIIGISDYTEEEIMLVSHGGRLNIKGKNIRLTVFESNTVEIIGKITGVEFLYGKN